MHLQLFFGLVIHSYRKLFLDACSLIAVHMKGVATITRLKFPRMQPYVMKELLMLQLKKRFVNFYQSTSAFIVKYQYRPLLILFLVVFVVAATYNLGYMSVQWDEMPHLNGGLLLARGQVWDYMTTYAYYPPIFDLVTTGYLHLFGVTEVAGRLVALTFSVLAIWLVFEFAKRIFEPKKALLASVFLGTMPGFFWLSRVAMIETMLIFFFTLTAFAFYNWFTNVSSYRALLFSGLVLGIGVLAKYQMVVAIIAMLLSILFLIRSRLKANLGKFLLLVAIVALVAIPWFASIYHYNGMTKFETIQYVMSEGGQDRPAYSNRFQPIPIYYIVEMTWPFNDIAVHPISLPIMILGLCGLGLFAYRRSKKDMFLLTWFLVVYVFFTLIPNRQWRYVTPLFPILAIAAGCFVIFFYSKLRGWNPQYVGVRIERLKKLAAIAFIAIIAGAVAYSSYDAYQMTVRDQIPIPIKEATAYLADHLNQNESAVVVCAFNLLDQNMFRFYLPPTMSSQQIWQYPDLAVDAFTPNFNIEEFVRLCEERNVKYIILFDWGPNTKFFNTTLDYQEVQTQIYNTNRFDDPLDRPFFGPFADNKGFRLFLVRFLK